jgi:hypothetical protein
MTRAQGAPARRAEESVAVATVTVSTVDVPPLTGSVGLPRSLALVAIDAYARSAADTDRTRSTGGYGRSLSLRDPARGWLLFADVQLDRPGRNVGGNLVTVTHQRDEPASRSFG